VCFVAQLASDICRDANETAIATNVEMAGKIAVLLIALPLFGEIADLVVNLMK
jgi:stage III sporulation protein AD